MKIYFAGAESSPYHEMLLAKGVKRALVSYFYVKSKKPEHILVFPDMFLDSGAFSAFVGNAVIDINEYIEFIKGYENRLSIYANLDVIGNAEASHTNYMYMLKRGVKPLPVYHVGSPTEYLHEYFKTADYIALGGMVGKPKKVLIPFLEKVFSIAKDYWPKKIHGFGLTSTSLMQSYPFYSVDSTSWLGPSRYGGIVRYHKGKVRSNDSEFDNILGKTLNYRQRTSKAIDGFLSMEQYITQLWERKGIKW